MDYRENSITVSDYISRINRVIDYIENNIALNFTLDELSEIASFSKFHFHRIFQSITGETLFQFIQRVRLERSAMLLKNNRYETITEIAMECGFTSSALFSRSFKKYFNLTPTQFKEERGYRKNSNLSQIISNTEKDINHSKLYTQIINHNKWKILGDERVKFIEIKEVDDIETAYLRYIGNYKKNQNLFRNLFDRLHRWAQPRNLIDDNTLHILIYHDNPAITDENKLRVSACITVPKNTKVSKDIGKLTLRAGKYAAIRFHISVDDFFFAWDWVYRYWLPQSGYLPDNKHCFEVYLNEKDPLHPNHFVIDIYVPITPE